MGTRDQILDAAAQVLRTRGFARMTTKEIARTAGYSEATLYKHFADKTALVVGVIGERMPAFVPMLKRLLEEPGSGTVEGNLVELAEAAAQFYEAGFPMLASMFSEPQMLAAHRESMSRTGAGPHRAVDSVTAYLRAEQRLGRVTPDADLVAASAMLLGACFLGAFLHNFAGPDAPLPSTPTLPSPAATARLVAHTITPSH